MLVCFHTGELPGLKCPNLSICPSFIPSIHPLSWQQLYVPVLSRSMLDFLMVSTALLMGCHICHFEEVAAVSMQARAQAGTSITVGLKGNIDDLPGHQ